MKIKILRFFLGLFILFSVFELNTLAQAREDPVNSTQKNNVSTVIGPDTRTRVECPESSPNTSPIGRIRSTFPDGHVGYGTGFLIGDNLAVTAAHVLYAHLNGGFAISSTFTPGASESNGAPFGTANIVEVRIPPLFTIDLLNFPLYDYAVFQIDRPLGADASANHFDMVAPDRALFLSENIQMTGYPLSTHGSQTDDMWTASGAALPVANDRRLSYGIPTSSGQSGAPIYFSNDPRYIVGIHTSGVGVSSNLNSGVLINEEVHNFITNAFN